MRSFLWGMGAGICLTLLCVAGYVAIHGDTTSPTASSTSTPAAGRYSPESRRSPGLRPDQRHRTALRGTDLPAPKTTGANSFTTVQENRAKSPDQNPVPAAVERLAQSMGMNRFDRFRAFRGQYEALKKMGRDAVPELLAILQGQGTQLSKIIAASLLGSINADLKDDEVLQILRMEGVPLLESILESDSIPLSGKRQALFALGEIGIEDAQQVLIDVLTSEQSRRIQGYALRILGRKGTIDSAIQLLSFLDGPKDETQFMTAARAIGMINNRASDPELSLELMGAVPALEAIVHDETHTMRKKQEALFQLQ